MAGRRSGPQPEPDVHPEVEPHADGPQTMRGLKTGGRKKGTPNRRTVARRNEAAIVAAGGMTPLAYMLAVMQDEEKTPALRMEAAKSAAPYVHARLATTELRSPELDKLGDAMAELVRRAQEGGGGVAGLLKR